MRTQSLRFFRIFNISGDNERANVLQECLKDGGLHTDCINGVSFHPYISEVVATCSGQRHHHLNLSSWGYSTDDENEQIYRKENSLKVWNLGIK